MSPSASLPERIRASRFTHIDALRAFAVGLVVLQHAGATAGTPLQSVPGDAGVTTFFVISGFVISYVLMRDQVAGRPFSIGAFYVKRFLKLAPPFFVAVAIPTVIFGGILGLFNLNWLLFATQAFFGFNWMQVTGNADYSTILPGSQVVWSLAIEEQFYIVFALVWLVIWPRMGWLRATTVLAASVFVGSTVWRAVLVMNDVDPSRILRGTDTRIDAIALGILVACAFFAFEQGKLPRLTAMGRDWVLPTAAVLFVVGFAPFGPAYELTFRLTVVALSAALVILYGMMPNETRAKTLMFRLAGWKPVLVIGLASYSIYLVHYTLVETFVILIPDAPALLTLVVGIVLGLGAGIAMYYFIEIPAQKLKPILLRPNRRERVPAAQ